VQRKGRRGADDLTPLERALAARLRARGVTASADQLRELAAADPALREWGRIARRLAGPGRPGGAAEAP
jgi:predicted nucleic acid-binding protein